MASSRHGSDMIFSRLEEITTALNKTQDVCLRLKTPDPEFYRGFSVLKSFLIDRSLAAKIAISQWVMTTISLDDPRALAVLFCMDKIRDMNAEIDVYDYLRVGRLFHPSIDGRPKTFETAHEKSIRARVKADRVGKMLRLAHEVRHKYVSLFGNPPPTNFFTRDRLFHGLSDQETLALFVAITSYQEPLWLARAAEEAQDPDKTISAATGIIDAPRIRRLAYLFSIAVQQTLHDMDRDDANSSDHGSNSDRMYGITIPVLEEGADTTSRWVDPSSDSQTRLSGQEPSSSLSRLPGT